MLSISLRGSSSSIEQQQTIAGYRYNSTIVHLIINAVYHHSAENLESRRLMVHLLQIIVQQVIIQHRSNLNGKSQIFNRIGNLTCIFEVGYWNLESQKHPTNLDRRRTCGNLRYIPSKDYIPSNIDIVFDKLLSNGENPTIYIVGDSIGRQHATDLLCYFASESRLVHVDIDPMGKPSEKGCAKNNDCHADTRNEYSGLGLSGATFQSYNDNATTNNSTHNNGLINIVFEGWNKDNSKKFKKALEKGKHGDIIVVNQGLHFSGYEPIVNALNSTYKDTILLAKNRGARIIWRETAAGHSNAPDGYWDPSLKALQANKSAYCVSSSMINATASRLKFNNVVVEMLKSWGVDILEIWEASLLMPEWCHVGGGVDCAHYIQPGGTSYFTEVLLKYIEEKM